MSGAIGVIIALTVLALTTLFGGAFFLGGLLIGVMSLLGYAIGGLIGAAVFAVLATALVLHALGVRWPKL